MAVDTRDWQELYEGAHEKLGPHWAAIFMRAMEPSLREDLATKGDLAELRTEMADLRTAVETQLRAQTWKVVGAFLGVGSLMVMLARL